MALNPNQFIQTPSPGYLDLQTGLNNVISGIMNTGLTAVPVATAVKIVDNFNPIPAVTPFTANTDALWGFIAVNIKDASYSAGDRVEIARSGTVMQMTAGGAIARGAKVEYAFASNKVITSAGTNTVVGVAFDKAGADGDIIRVIIA